MRGQRGVISYSPLFLTLLFKVFGVPRAIFKRRNPGAAEDGSVKVFIDDVFQKQAPHQQHHHHRRRTATTTFSFKYLHP